ncbi:MULTISPECIES: hypothetical protein [Streptomyces]|uniref:hypothetical protein n=1 Tax=Streptomyces TaxID=1883 RepID=UPI0002F45C6B|nr:hypothetical protein [Streptomyces venezuelae]APE21371.1 hypothetical protein vnz_10290 [Streptomyces venezuelae]QER98760.1 hypothetical protein DEJ43_10420 [Streptomyces venezuelae ATCC 10712]
MIVEQPPLWPDGWEHEADAKAGTHRQPRRWARSVPTDHGRPCTRPQIPHRRVVNVIRSL